MFGCRRYLSARYPLVKKLLGNARKAATSLHVALPDSPISTKASQPLHVKQSAIVTMASKWWRVGPTNLKMLGTEYIVGLDEPHDGIFDTLRLTRSDTLRWTHIAFRDTDEALKAALHENRTVSTTIVLQPGDEIVGRR